MLAWFFLCDPTFLNKLFQKKRAELAANMIVRFLQVFVGYFYYLSHYSYKTYLLYFAAVVLAHT